MNKRLAYSICWAMNNVLRGRYHVILDGKYQFFIDIPDVIAQ